MDETELRELATSVLSEIRLNSGKTAQIIARLKQIPMRPNTAVGVLKGTGKLMKTWKVMDHKMKNDSERVETMVKSKNNKKPDLSGLKQALQIQLDVAKLANKQADVIISELNIIADKKINEASPSSLPESRPA